MKIDFDNIDFEQILHEIYEKALNGVPKVSKPIPDLANDYLLKYKDSEKASKELIKYQTIKCTTSGFLTSLGGLITLPVAIPANVGSVIYVQLRMISALAYIGGFDINSDQVETMSYVCLTGSAAADILKSAGIKFGEKFTTNLIQKIPGKTLTAINQKVGFRFITKFGETGIINLGKAVPILSGFIGGGIDLTSTKIIANNAYNLFIKNEIPNNTKDELVIDVEINDEDENDPYEKW